MSSSDDNLLEKAASGDPDALGTLLEQYAVRLRGQMSGEVPPRWRSVLSIDDILQETYIDAFLDVCGFDYRGEGSFFAWLITLAKRNLLDAIRMLEADKRGRNKRRIEPRDNDEHFGILYEQLAYSRGTPSHDIRKKEAGASLRNAIEQLPPTYRKVVEMYDIQGCGIDVLAEALERKPGAVFMLRNRAHRFLRKYMGRASQYLSDSR
ncbi:MAG: sigma-70 family RNA polymerase sigma factor [Planctomycetota bacterium]